MKKILLITPTSRQVLGFRSKLIEKLQQEGYFVSVLTFDDINKEEILKRNIDFHYIADKNRGQNPFKVLSLTQRYAKEIKEISPDIVFTFMLKPNTFGVLAAKKAGVKKIYSMVEGAGDVFTNGGIKWKVIRAYVCYRYKKSFKNSRAVFFLNNDDKAEFVRRGLVKDEQCRSIRGIGIDFEKFTYSPVENQRSFLMLARMLRTKGIYEYCRCARIVKQKYPDAVFKFLGREASVTLEDIKEYIEDGSIEYLGVTDDVRPYYKECSVNILPSYREGFGLVNMEAAAMGRPSITGETNGTRDTVKDGVTGFTVPIKNAEALAEKAIWFIEHPDEVKKMGLKAREFAEENCDQKKINEYILSVIEEKN